MLISYITEKVSVPDYVQIELSYASVIGNSLFFTEKKIIIEF